MPSRKKYTKKRLAKKPHRITPTKLAEAMPNVAELLQRDNEADQNAGMEELANTILPKNDIAMTKDGRTMDRLDFTMMVLAGLVVTGTSAAESTLKQTLQESIKLNYLLCTLADKEQHDGGLETLAGEKVTKLKFCFDEAVDEHKDAIVAICFGGDTATFYSRCKAYNTSLEAFGDLFFEAGFALEDIETRGIQDTLEKMAAAAAGLRLGMDKSTATCWLCGKEAEHCCSQCQAAKYCSRECQVAHWKDPEGHKASCSAIKPTFVAIESQIATVDAAFGDPKAHTRNVGLEPAVFDWSLLRLNSLYLMQMRGVLVHDEGIRSLAVTHAVMNQLLPWKKCPNGPSMDNFYKNIKNLVRDGFLLTSTPSTKPISPKQCNRDEDQCMAIARAMLFGYSELPREVALGVFWDCAGDEFNGTFDMSPEEWLFNYCDGERYLEDGPACKKFYLQYFRHTMEREINELFRSNLSAIEKGGGFLDFMEEMHSATKDD